MLTLCVDRELFIFMKYLGPSKETTEKSSTATCWFLQSAPFTLKGEQEGKGKLIQDDAKTYSNFL